MLSAVIAAVAETPLASDLVTIVLAVINCGQTLMLAYLATVQHTARVEKRRERKSEPTT